MIAQETILVQLVRLIDRIPTPPPSTRPCRGRPPVYSDGLFLKALVVMIVKRLHRVGELLAVLDEPTPEMRALRGLLLRAGPLPLAAHLREAAARPARDAARAHRLPGTAPGSVA